MSLKDEIAKGEGYSLEFKRLPNEDRGKYLKTVVAFANGKGGRILFGVANDRTIVGIPAEDLFTEMDGITNSITDSCEPKIAFDLGVENIDGKAIIVLEVFAGSNCPYYLKSEGDKDGVYVRVAATTCVADDATRRELAYLSEGRSFDGEPCPKAKIDDERVKKLCSVMYRIARKNCDTEAERRTVKRITPQQLESWGVISKVRGKLIGNNAYALLTGDPAFAIRLKCGVFKGDDRSVFVDRREFTGSVMELIDKGVEYLLEKINMGCYFKGAFRHDRYELPPDELRELVVNAFAHRSYLDHDAPVFLAVYDTRVEITSPGGLPRGQTAERALAGYSKIRNDVLAKALNYMRYIEEWGSGLKRVNDVLAGYGIDAVKLDEAGFATRMEVRRDSQSRSTDPKCDPDDPKIDPNDPKVPKNGGIGPELASLLDRIDDADEKRIVGILAGRPTISRAALAKDLQMSERQVRNVLTRLADRGVIAKSGRTSAMRWLVKYN